MHNECNVCRNLEGNDRCKTCGSAPCPAGCGIRISPWNKFLHRERCEPYKAIDAQTPAIVLLVEWLADGYAWNWTLHHSDEDCATKMLGKMVDLGMCEHVRHPMGGNIWIINDRLLGRTDGITLNEKGEIMYKGRLIQKPAA
jgi:hypothetical protein